MPDSESNGLMKSLAKLSDTLLSILQNRVALFSLEVREEKFKLIVDLMIALAAVFAGVLAVTVLTVAIVVYACDEENRLRWLLIFGAVYGVAALWGFASLKRRIRGRSRPFEQTLTEIEKDRAWLDRRK